jgi:hypothetical protein
MTHAATITITFSDYWLSSTGGSGKGDLDMVCARDADGCPILPMSQVKGMLRETAELLYPDKEVIDLFGERTIENAPKPPKEGALRFSGNASLRHEDHFWFAKNTGSRAGLFSRLRSTQITDAGVADDNSLRTAEVAVPLTLQSTIYWVGSGEPPKDTLDTLCKLTFAFGHGKNDGLGRAMAKCSEFTPSPSDRIEAQGTCLVIDLIPEDLAVFSQANANQGQQRSHAGPTGASLWGWAIGRLKDDPAALKLLLSGKISFSDAAPLIDGKTPAFMRPSILFAPKQAMNDAERVFGADKNFNPAALRIGMSKYVQDYTEDRQAKALGAYHMSLALDRIAPVGKGHRLRSAHVAGKADEGRLFGYQHIEQRITGYRAVIEAQNAVDMMLWAKIIETFSNRLFLGKARNNGYGGGYAVKEARGAHLVPDVNRTIVAGAMEAHIWCLSDMALYDDWGTLKVEPCAGDFDLPEGWSLNRTESAVTTRRYAPWDRAIQGHEREITVVEAGSVFTLTGPALSNAIILPERIGVSGERGCGWIAIVPGTTPTKARDNNSANTDTETAVETDLTKWAGKRVMARDTRNLDKWIKEAQTAIDQISRGPTKTQWSKVKLDGEESALNLDHSWGIKIGDKTLKEWLIAQAAAQNDWPEPHKKMARKRLVDHARRKATAGARDRE